MLLTLIPYYFSAWRQIGLLQSFWWWNQTYHHQNKEVLNEECVSEHLSPEDFKQTFCLSPNGSTYPLSSTCAADVHFSFPTTKDISLCTKYLWVIDHFKQALQPCLICVLSAGYCCPGLCYYSNWEQVFLRPGSLHTPHFRKLSIKSNLVMAHKGSITCPHQLIFLR